LRLWWRRSWRAAFGEVSVGDVEHVVLEGAPLRPVRKIGAGVDGQVGFAVFGEDRVVAGEAGCPGDPSPPVQHGHGELLEGVRGGAVDAEFPIGAERDAVFACSFGENTQRLEYGLAGHDVAPSLVPSCLVANSCNSVGSSWSLMRCDQVEVTVFP